MALAIIVGCSRPAPAVGPTADVVYAELVDAGCLEPSDDGVSFVLAERSIDGGPPWLQCLFNGGTVYTCAVPCQ